MLIKRDRRAGEGFPHIGDFDLRRALREGAVALADDGRGPALDGGIDEVVAVGALAGNRHEHHAGGDAAGVVGDPRHFAFERTFHAQRRELLDELLELHGRAAFQSLRTDAVFKGASFIVAVTGSGLGSSASGWIFR